MRYKVKSVTAAALLTALILGLTSTTAQAQPNVIAPGLSDATVRAAVSRACSSLCSLAQLTRARIADGVVEYSITVTVGQGPHDRIRLHRVVAESDVTPRPPTGRAVFFVHGDVWAFDAAFAGDVGRAERAPNVATYLAQRGDDVWGIDLRWTLVPPGTSDLSFMKSWTMSTDVRDLRIGTTIERAVRGLTGAGADQTALVGWSRGGQMAYGLANDEARLPSGLRNVNALVPVDIALRYSPAENQFRETLCQSYQQGQQALTDGTYAADVSVYAKFGEDALARPSATSDLIPPLSNREAALLVGTSVNGVFNAGFHFLAPQDTVDGVPTGLAFTPEKSWFGFLSKGAPFESQGTLVQGGKIMCGYPDPLVSNLAAVRVPVLYLGAAGGFGSSGIYSTTLLGSTDVTTQLVRLRPPGEEERDFGHVDLWQATNAPQLVWGPLHQWLRAH